MFGRYKRNSDGAQQKIESLQEKILFLYGENNDLGIKSLIKNQPINLLIDSLEEIDDEDICLRFLIGAYKIKMGELFLSFNDSMKERMLAKMKSGLISRLLEDLNTDDVYEIYSQTTPYIQRKIIFNASKNLKEEIKRLKEFGFAEAGSIMNTTYITLLESMNISEAIHFLRISSQSFDLGEDVFVLNADGEVVGQANVKKLFFNYFDHNGDNFTLPGIISDIAEKSFVSANEDEDIDEIIDLFKKYSVKSIAIINKEQKLVGIIDYQDIIPEILESNIEDIHKFYGIKETAKSYLNSSILEIVKSRITCLIIMLFAATVTTFAIDKFEQLGIEYTAGISTAILVPIIPIITDMCGNTGSQTTATIIQAFSAGELKESDFRTAIKKELKIATVVGAILAMLNFARLLVYFIISIKWDFGSFKSKIHSTSGDIQQASALQICIIGAISSSISLWLVTIFSKLFGVIIPLTAIRFDYDPAAVSAPVLTTILDTVASIIFFGIGVLMLKWAITSMLNWSVSDGKLSITSQVSINNLLSAFR